MKRLSTFALLGVMALGCAYAQQQAPPPPAPDQTAPPAQQQQAQRHAVNPDRQLKMLTKRLNLTADQQAQLRPILEDRASQADAIRNDASLQKKDKRDKMRSLRDDSTQKIEALLTPEQKQNYDSMMQRMKGHRQSKPAGADSNS